MSEIFNKLNGINVNEHTEKKNGLTYLSWAWAWGKLKEFYPDANYTVYTNELNGMPYFTDGKTCTVKVGVTVEGLEHIEFLPVMDYRNKSIPYEAVTSFDVNKAVQRCLTKAIARHGLGLYIYAGEDLPEEEKAEKPARKFSLPPDAEPKAPKKAEKKPDGTDVLIPICEECGETVKPTIDKEGNEMSAVTVALIAKAKAGRCLCADCTKKALAKK